MHLKPKLKRVGNKLPTLRLLSGNNAQIDVAGNLKNSGTIAGRNALAYTKSSSTATQQA